MARYRGRHVAAKQAGRTGRRSWRSSRLRRGLGGTAVAAVAMAALTASQAPGLEHTEPDRSQGRAGTSPGGDGAGDGSYHTELPPLKSPHPPGSSPSMPDPAGAESGIPATVLAAYKKAARDLRADVPGCGLRWELLAAIGKVESGQARGGDVTADGTTRKPILGPVLNGGEFARISDTDGGKWDGDSRYDRAVGPMQFIPSTWARWGADGNGDGTKDPNNIHDAALAAGRYLCADGRALDRKADLDRAILSYNNSRDYLRTVLAWYEFYREGTHKVPDGSAALPTSPGSGNSRKPGAGSSDRADKPGKPSKGGGKDGGSGGNGSAPAPGGGSGTPSPSPTPTPTPTAPADLQPVGASEFSAPVGGKFEKRPEVRVLTSEGKPVKGVKVEFTLEGETGAHFGEDATTAEVSTAADGTATAPAIEAGEQPGAFTVKAKAAKLTALSFDAEVVEPQSDTLVRTGDAALETATGAEFGEQVEVKTSLDSSAAPHAAVRATMVTEGEKPEENTVGPYFTDSAGETIRTVTLRADGEGVLTLPKITADDEAGTYLLRLDSVAGGGTLTLELKVTD